MDRGGTIGSDLGEIYSVLPNVTLSTSRCEEGKIPGLRRPCRCPPRERARPDPAVTCLRFSPFRAKDVMGVVRNQEKAPIGATPLLVGVSGQPVRTLLLHCLCVWHAGAMPKLVCSVLYERACET